MSDLSNLDEEDEYSHRIDIIDAENEVEYEVLITEVEKPTHEKLEDKKSNPNFKTKILREDFGEVTEEEYGTKKLLESNDNKLLETRSQFVILNICYKNLTSMSVASGPDEKSSEMVGLAMTESR